MAMVHGCLSLLLFSSLLRLLHDLVDPSLSSTSCWQCVDRSIYFHHTIYVYIYIYVHPFEAGLRTVEINASR